MAVTERARKPPIIIPAPRTTAAPATLIFIHGYNDTASAFNHDPPDGFSVAHHIHKSSALQHVKIIIPEALPCKWPTIPDNVWYNIDRPFPRPGDPNKVKFGDYGSSLEDMAVSLDYFESLIESEIANGTRANRIVFLGYSQGASILLLLALTRRIAADLGAIISFAGFSAVPLETYEMLQEQNGLRDAWNTKLFMLQGKQDKFAPLLNFHALVDVLHGFCQRSRGVASVESKVIDGLRHAPTNVLWPHVRHILEEVLPGLEEKQSLKL